MACTLPMTAFPDEQVFQFPQPYSGPTISPMHQSVGGVGPLRDYTTVIPNTATMTNYHYYSTQQLGFPDCPDNYDFSVNQNNGHFDKNAHSFYLNISPPVTHKEAGENIGYYGSPFNQGCYITNNQDTHIVSRDSLKF